MERNNKQMSTATIPYEILSLEDIERARREARYEIEVSKAVEELIMIERGWDDFEHLSKQHKQSIEKEILARTDAYIKQFPCP